MAHTTVTSMTHANMNAEQLQRTLDKADADAHAEFVAEWRGRELLPGVYRQFCVRCGGPFTVVDRTLRDRLTLLCDRCPARPSGNTIAGTAFSPDRKLSR